MSINQHRIVPNGARFVAQIEGAARRFNGAPVLGQREETTRAPKGRKQETEREGTASSGAPDLLMGAQPRMLEV